MDKPWKVIFAFVGVFIAGAVFGAFFSLRSGGRLPRIQGAGFRNQGAPAMQNPPPQPNQQRPMLGAMQPIQAAQIMRRYAERLDLTAEQKDRIHPLIQRATEDIRRQQQNNFRENGIIVQRLQQDIAKELTGEQRARLEKMEQRQREMMQQQRAGNGEPGGMGPRPGSPGRETFRGGGTRPPAEPREGPVRQPPPVGPADEGRK